MSNTNTDPNTEVFTPNPPEDDYLDNYTEYTNPYEDDRLSAIVGDAFSDIGEPDPSPW